MSRNRSTTVSTVGSDVLAENAVNPVVIDRPYFCTMLLDSDVFAVPGVGRLVVGAIRQLDFPIVQAGVFLLALIVVLVNFAVDLLYVYLNPQIRVR